MKDKNLVKLPYKIIKCPFCGETPIVERKMLFTAFVVRCNNPKCEIQPSTKMHKEVAEAVAAWRKRGKDGNISN